MFRFSFWLKVIIGAVAIISLIAIEKDVFQNFISQYFPFQAALIEILPEEKEILPENLALEKEISSETEEEKEKEEPFFLEEKTGGPEINLIEIQEKIEGIAERIDLLNQEVIDLIEESQDLPKETSEITEEEEKEEPEEIEEELEEEVGQEEVGQELGQVLCEKIIGSQPARNKAIINEVAWMGTIISANDEWIELKNISSQEIDLTSWQILNKDQKIKIIFDTGLTSVKLTQVRPVSISPNGFFLLERTNDDSVPGIAADLIYTGALKNENEALYLFDGNCQLQDEVEANPNWPAGDNSSKRTMERRSDLSWQTSLDPGGTPKRENSSGYLPYSGVGGGGAPPPTEPRITLSYQKENPVNKEIEVFLSVSDFKDALYDVKISIEKDEVLSDIYNEKELKWQSSFNYLNEVFSGNSFEGQFKLKIKDDKKDFRGEADILVRIRETGKTKYFEFIDKIKILEPEILPDITPPQIIFNLEFIQTNLSFTIFWQAEDPIIEFATTSGLDGFSLQYSVTPSDIDGISYQDEDGNWQNWKENEILAIRPDQNQLTLLGKDEYNYNFQIKAKDKAGNESNWAEASIRISLPKPILINEVQIDSLPGPGGVNDDWVELYNPNDFEISLAGWSIQEHSASVPCSTATGFYKKNFPSDAKIPPKGFFLIVDTEANENLKNIADLTIGWSLTNNNTIYLVRNQDQIEGGQDPDIVDKVGFGNACFPEGEAASNPEEGGSLERINFQDTDDNSQDFVLQPNPSPQNSKF